MIAFFVFGDKMLGVEIVSMFMCFSGAVTIAVSGTKSANQAEEQGDITRYSSS